MKLNAKLAVLLIIVQFIGISRIHLILAEEITSDELQNHRSDLESQLAELELQIAEQQTQIKKYGDQKKTLQGEINSLNSQVKKLNLEIKTVDLQITKVNQNITETQKNINGTEQGIDEHKIAISHALRIIQESDHQSIVEIFLANTELSDFVSSVNNLSLVQNNLRASLEKITKLRENLIRSKQVLAIEKEDAESLKNVRQSQKQEVTQVQGQKENILKVTKGKESEYQKLLKKTQETAADIRVRIFQLLGGGELTFEKAYEYAHLAEKATGVHASYTLAILQRESLLGKNTGRCVYNQKMSGGTTAMNPKEIPTFLDILNRLGIDPESTVAKISCPNQDGTYGGAMGPAQFIPSTWKIYESKISAITGSNPPNPWNNSDAFVATALYLKNFGADGGSAAQAKKAAAIYYCGSNWQRTSCSYYANKVIETAQKFQADINVLENS